MKTLLILLTLSTVACASPRIGHTPASRIVTAADMPGKHENGKCLLFATEAARRLNAAGIPARVIGFSQEDGTGHAIVAYEDKGRTYVADNTSRPRWVKGGSNADIIKQWQGVDYGSFRVSTFD